MGVLEEVLQNKEEILINFLKILEGKETKATVNLDGIEFKVGNSTVKMNGSVEFVFVPIDQQK